MGTRQGRQRPRRPSRLPRPASCCWPAPWIIEGDLPPVLTISDTSDIIIPVNGTWSVPSATCTDKEDGDLTDEIEVRHVNSVDVTKPGTYYITYYCVDSTNQHVQTSIKVIVEEGS